MIHLAAELGISDVGLAKACRRHAVPVPPRGYWAKVQAGHKPPRLALPTPELDVTVDFMTSDPEERARQKALSTQRKEAVRARVDAALAKVAVSVPERLDRPHPLVAATKRYFERVPRLIEQYKRRGIRAWQITKDEDRPPPEQHGRYTFFREGQLNITASLDAMDWILRFHDAVLKALVAGGMKVEWCPAAEGRRHDQQRPACVQLSQSGETWKIEFSQGYRRVALTASELAERRKSQSWAREFEYRPSEKLTFRVTGSEYGASKAWEGTREKLQGQIESIVRTIFELVPLQAELRAAREAAAEVARRKAEVAAEAQRRRGARTEQLKQAFLMAEAADRQRGLEEFLTRLERTVAEMPEPTKERALVWMQVVREELARSRPVEALLQACLAVPSWRTWPPDWWPNAAEGPTAERDDDPDS